MKKKRFSVRLAELSDASALLEIYTPFVVSEDSSLSDVSFEYEAPSEEEFRSRITGISAAYPYLVLEVDGVPAGYAYAHPYIQRAAYQWDAEVTIYLAPAVQGKGLGCRLYAVLEKLLALQGIINLYSCITGSNKHSIMMHRSMGYEIIGHFNRSGFKHGHWLDMVWMGKAMGNYPARPALIKPFSSIDRRKVQEILRQAERELNSK